MANAYGNTTGTANSKFRVVLEYTASNLGNGYYQYKYRYYVQVTTGNFYGTSLTRSWGSNITINGTGKYGYSGYATKNVAYGANFTLGSTLYAQYTGSQTYRSEIAGNKVIAKVPKPTYAVKYNANGGTGAPGQQTKTYGTTLKLSTTKPTRTGYTFQGWGTSSGDTSVNYAAGANYTANASITLYAIWKANTYTVTYDANGGSGAPGKQTKTYGVTLVLTSSIPTRTNYNFIGWGTSAASTTVAYEPGSNYTGNSAITLYAIWSLAYVKPIIEITSLDRCTSSGTYTDDGTYAKIIFNWSTEYPVSSMKVEYKLSTSSSWISGGSISASGTSGTSQKIFGGSLDSESQYNVMITVADSNGSSIAIKTLGAMTFEIDFLSGGKGVAIGKPATNKGFEVAYDTVFEKNISFSINSVLSIPDIGTDLLGFNNSVPGVYRPTILDDIALDNGKWLQGKLTGGYFTNILRMNASNQVELNWTSGGLKGRVMKELWTGTWTSGSLTISELPFYNILLIGVSDTAGDSSENRFIAAYRSVTNVFSGIGVSPLGNNDTRLIVASFASSGTSLSYNYGVRHIVLNSSGVTSIKDNRKVYSIYGLL